MLAQDTHTIKKDLLLLSRRDINNKIRENFLAMILLHLALISHILHDKIYIFAYINFILLRTTTHMKRFPKKHCLLCTTTLL